MVTYGTVEYIRVHKKEREAQASHGTGRAEAMGGGGGGSGYVHTTTLLGQTFAGHRQIPAMFEDPDLPQGGSSYTAHAFGGETCWHGGDGYCVIYY